MIRYQSILHASVIVSSTQKAVDFYHDILGMEVARGRPDLGYPGAWLQIGMQQVHLLEVPNPDPINGRPKHGGRDRHIAFEVEELTSLINALDRAAIPYTLSRSGRNALFCRDPDGNALEFIASN